ncbi:hypothetical protein PPYR_03245 [Photinus pyralis]|uniref:Nuclear speckle splicing regulatory protein 1 N-terminal domain-containing protein n=2 Tax=Photinus pyralis TaxID=7054 RepID=A0A1Y1NDN6_PHOPY|nr:nuclear speckle splicing regulatory protein 1 [Photinus pyralis]KAB0791445.1 hypothetical protein PPYR_03245 [Photinus pyralis]
MEKQYGLIVPNKSKPLHPIGPVRPSIFGNDSDSDSGAAKPTGLKTALKRQDRLLQEKAIEEDPTVFQYDELYDDMDAKRKESKLSRKDLDKKPKYINKLLQSAERRKRENERRIERQVQREREAEGEEFKDKDSFVTSAYRAKLEELKKLDEEEEREDYLEAIGDVRKQGNIDGFYRHLYDQKVLYEDKVEEGEGAKSKRRRYRSQREQSSDSEPEVKPQLQHLPSNIDADSDFSIDSSDSEGEKGRAEAVPPVEAATETSAEVVRTDENKTEAEEVEEVKVEAKVREKVKVDIWKKRTVGDVFDSALRRYFERKALRESGSYVRPIL